MKKLTMILALAFTMGLAASTVSAATKDKTKKEKTECAKSKECTKETKSCCGAKAEKAEKPVPAPAK